MTAGREKKPFDYEIPDRGRTQKRVFDDTEPLIVNGRPLEPEVTMEPSKIPDIQIREPIMKCIPLTVALVNG